MEESQDNSQRPGTRIRLAISISLSRNACSPAHFGTSIQINGDRNEMLDYVPHDPAIMEFVWQLVGIAEPILSIRQGFLFHCGISRNSISLGKSHYRVGPIQF
jgi:hypothetical protein